MKARSGMQAQGRLFEIEMEGDDLYGFYDEVAVKEMTGKQKFRALSMHADLMVVEYMGREGLISKEYALQRVREIKETWGGSDSG